MEQGRDIFARLRDGESVSMLDPEYMKVVQELQNAWQRCNEINCTPSMEKQFAMTAELFEGSLPESTRIVAPFNIDIPRSLVLGKQVFINRNLTCMNDGGITIDDNVQIAPNVTLTTVNHDLNDRYTLKCKGIHICRNAWIGACALILPGVTIGENAVVAGGSVVTKDVEPNSVVAGNPAKVIKRME